MLFHNDMTSASRDLDQEETARLNIIGLTVSTSINNTVECSYRRPRLNVIMIEGWLVIEDEEEHVGQLILQADNRASSAR